MPKLSTELNIFIEESSKDLPKLIGRLNYWYHHGCDDSVLSDLDRSFMEIVDTAYHIRTDFRQPTSKTAQLNKIKELYGIKSNSQVQFVFQVADALYSSERAEDHRYRLALADKFLMEKMKECDEYKDHKNALKFFQEWAKLHKLYDSDRENDNHIVAKTIELATNNELLEQYDAHNSEKTKNYIKRLEDRAKTEVYGE